jgi:hypothetical protein
MIDCLPVCCLLRRRSDKDERDLASEKEVAAGKAIEGKLRISEDTIHIYYFIFSAEFVLLRYGSFKNLMRINTRSAKRFRQAA